MKKRIVAITCAFLVLISALSIPIYADNSATVVYVTRTGYAYHKSGCSYLRSKIELTLREAVESGYSPCSRCHPPTPDFEYESRSTKKSTSGSRSSAESGTTRSNTGSASERADNSSNTSGILWGILIGSAATGLIVNLAKKSKGKPNQRGKQPSPIPQRGSPKTPTPSPPVEVSPESWLIYDGEKSTCFSRYGYNQQKSTLLVTFRGGGTYVYFGVPPAVWGEFQNADSKGRFFNEQILNKYPYESLH